MPVKRRLEKRRVDPRAEAAAWSGIFQCGFAMFDDEPEDLAAFGVELDAYGRAEPQTVEEAWNRLGSLYLGGHPPADCEPWALRQFGEPHAN